MTAIACHLAADTPVLVISGTTGSSASPAGSHKPIVLEVKNQRSEKGALIKRAIAEFLFTIRSFFALLAKLKKGDVAITVTAPFSLPYAVALSARLKGARSVLIMHDLYPDVLVMADVIRPTSITAKVIHFANALMYRALDAVVSIGRDMEQLLTRYKGMRKEKIFLIPNWATLSVGVRPTGQRNEYRTACRGEFIVGLSGNLGFTHDPVVVFEAARLLQGHKNIHFLLSGWGIGFKQLEQMQEQAQLPNVTLIGRVPESHLEQFLSAADIWIIPYRKNVAGVSVPSRFYNLLAVGRPVLIISEPEAEAALTVSEHDLGWVVPPGDVVKLAETIRMVAASTPELAVKRQQAAMIAKRYSFSKAMAGYRAVAQKFLGPSE
jgi:glycosyltransferase involved in cell wall biosynthesis